MIHLLYGEDTFTIEETVAAMKDGVGTADLRDVNINVLEGQQVTFEMVIGTASTVPFLADKRMVIVSGVLSRFERRAQNKGNAAGDPDSAPDIGPWKGLADALPRLPPTTDLVFVDGKLAATNPLLKLLRPLATVKTFAPPNPADLRQWIRTRAWEMRAEIEPRAIETLAESIGPDLRALATELQKLSLYRGDGPIRHEDVEAMVSSARVGSIFKAIDGMLEGRVDDAVSNVNQLLQGGEAPQLILHMMARQVRLLILAKDIKPLNLPQEEQSQRLGISGYPLKKTMEQQERFSTQRLVEIHRALVEADLSMKSTGVNEELVLDVLIAEVASRPGGGATVRGQGGYRR